MNKRPTCRTCWYAMPVLDKDTDEHFHQCRAFDIPVSEIEHGHTNEELDITTDQATFTEEHPDHGWIEACPKILDMSDFSKACVLQERNISLMAELSLRAHLQAPRS